MKNRQMPGNTRQTTQKVGCSSAKSSDVCNHEQLVWLAGLVWVVRSRQEVTASKLREKQDLIMEFPVLCYKVALSLFLQETHILRTY